MLVGKLMPAARARLVMIADDAPLIKAAKLLRAGTDLVVVCGPEGFWPASLQRPMSSTKSATVLGRVAPR